MVGNAKYIRRSATAEVAAFEIVPVLLDYTLPLHFYKKVYMLL
jgi:hypothetical protein